MKAYFRTSESLRLFYHLKYCTGNAEAAGKRTSLSLMKSAENPGIRANVHGHIFRHVKDVISIRGASCKMSDKLRTELTSLEAQSSFR